jgi:hypothetical protein
MGEPGAGFLFGGDGVEDGLQLIPHPRYGILLVEERDRVLELAAVVAKLVRGQCVQGVFRRIDGWGLPGGGGRHRKLFLTAFSW